MVCISQALVRTSQGLVRLSQTLGYKIYREKNIYSALAVKKIEVNFIFLARFLVSLPKRIMATEKKDIKREQARALRKQYFNEEAEELLRRFSEALNEKFSLNLHFSILLYS